METIFRSEHPNPQFIRENWINLNGVWQFEVDSGRSGKAKGYMKEEPVLADTICVPFCPESKRSGLENKDFMRAEWYKRHISLSQQQIGDNIVELHIGACDYSTEIWMNGLFVGSHRGGYSSFSFDITAFIHPGENTIAIYAEDDTRDPMIPSGKQSHEYNSFGCFYTRTTGIWQTVWLEFMPKSRIETVRFYPDIQQGTITLTIQFCGTEDFSAEILYKGNPMGNISCSACYGRRTFTVRLKEAHLWEPGCGRLYDIIMRFGKDEVRSYFGLREITLQGRKFMLNGTSVFQRLVLDQGFYPDGIYTAPDDKALKRDIEISMQAGFNGARLHEKVFEPRFLYHCDQMGYLVWGEYPNWGLDHSKKEAIYSILPEWTEILERDFNHPAIIGWCPFNETWDCGTPISRQQDDLIRMVYRQTKALDPTRPCIDTSGVSHVETDIHDVHDYDQNPQSFAARYRPIGETGAFEEPHYGDRQKYDGKKPVFVSEYGGTGLSLHSGSWSYGSAAKSCAEFNERYRGLTHALLENPEICGMCYTQLYDVEQEQNGLYTYDREPKTDITEIYRINTKKAAIEE